MPSEIKHYRSDEEFYADRGGARSGESDFGMWHHDDIGLFSTPGDMAIRGETVQVSDDEFIVISAARNNRIRVSVVDETGDVYAVQYGIGNGRACLLGNLGVKTPRARKRESIRDIGPTYEKAESAFEGWARSEDGKPCKGMSWFIERLRRMDRGSVLSA